MTRIEDVEAVANLPIAWAGFVFWAGSPRQVTVEWAAELERHLSPGIAAVGVFVNAGVREVAEAVTLVGLEAVQLHGDESVDDYLALDVPIIKAVHLSTDDDVERAAAYPPEVRLLVDARDDARRGGTGQQADWSRAACLAARREVVLAGGLNADNVAEAIRTVRPWGVDVSSGVEVTPGRKDASRIAAFARAVAGTASEVA
jgi:phosphoribosylanthranilate isomerase